MFLLGDVFLRNFYSVYDFQDLSVYLAVNEHSKDSVGFNQGLIKNVYDDTNSHAAKEENGMIWSVHQSVVHERNFFEGFIVGYYHDP